MLGHVLSVLSFGNVVGDGVGGGAGHGRGVMMRRSNDRGSLTLPKTSNFWVGLKITTNLIVGVLPPFVLTMSIRPHLVSLE